MNDIIQLERGRAVIRWLQIALSNNFFDVGFCCYLFDVIPNVVLPLLLIFFFFYLIEFLNHFFPFAYIRNISISVFISTLNSNFIDIIGILLNHFLITETEVVFLWHIEKVLSLRINKFVFNELSDLFSWII